MTSSCTHRVLVVLEHLGFGFEVVCGWHRVFIPAVPLLQDVCVQPRLHSCIQDHLKLGRLHLPRHSDGAVLFSHQTLKRRRERGRRAVQSSSVNSKTACSTVARFGHEIESVLPREKWFSLCCSYKKMLHLSSHTPTSIFTGSVKNNNCEQVRKTNKVAPKKRHLPTIRHKRPKITHFISNSIEQTLMLKVDENN